MDYVFDKYKSTPYFELEACLSNNYVLILKWNVFKDKKDNGAPVMRVRYILFDGDGNRLSLKALHMKDPVAFRQIYLSEDALEIIEVATSFQYREMFVSSHFGEWINTTFKKMIESGDYKITSLKSIKDKK